MAFQTESLLEEITSVDSECGQILQDVGIVADEDIQSLCYESLKDIFPGVGKKIVQRSKVWKIIQNSLKPDDDTSSNRTSCPSTPKSDDLTDSSSFLENDVVMVTPKLSKTVKVEHPEYSVYTDTEIRAASESGKMSKELKCRLVRATIHNMISTAAAAPFLRYPLTMELEEMSKSLILAYPCLRDPENGHVDLFTKLKRKLSNSKPTRKPQGPCPNKRRRKDNDSTSSPCPKITDFLKGCSSPGPSGESNQDESTVPLNDGNKSGESNQDESTVPLNDEINDPVKDNAEVMKRHHKLLSAEMNKKRPNVDIANSYLNKTFESRREWLKSISAEKRCEMVLETYPCFTDHLEVIEEARRVLEVEASERSWFMNNCVRRLNEELDFLLFYGISKGISPPRSPKLSGKLVHTLKKISNLFPRSKSLKKTPELLHELQDHEDPDFYCLKQVGNLPMLVLDKEIVYVIVGKIILLRVPLEKMSEAVVAFLASFYLLDFDYPKQHEYGLVMLQTIVFQDNRIPQDIAHQFTAMEKAFKKYKS